MQTANLINLHERIRRYALRHSRDPHAADDVAQEVIARLLQALQSGDAPDQPLGWVLRAARNRLVDDGRARARHAVTVPDDVWDAMASTGPPALPSDAANLAGCLHQMVDLLPEEYREPIRRADLLEQDRAQVARDLGLSMTALKTRVMRGRRQLHGLLVGCCRFEFNGADGRLDEIVPRHAATDDSASDDSCSSCGCSPHQAAPDSPAPDANPEPTDDRT